MSSPRRASFLLLPLLALAPWGCESGDVAEARGRLSTPAPSPGPPPSPPPPVPVAPVVAHDEPPRLVRLQHDADDVLRSYCAGCHAWTTTALVHARAACGGRGARLVVPRDLGRSQLYGKVSGDTACGGPMPPAGALPPASLAALRTWILEGAPIDGSPTSPAVASCVKCARSGVEDELEVNALNRDD